MTTGSSVVRTRTVVRARVESVAYGSSSVGQPVKRAVLAAPHSGPGKSGATGAASANKAYAAGTSILLRATDPQTNVSIQAKGDTIVTFGQQGQLKPSTPLVFAACYRSGNSGAGTITAKVPGAQLDVNGSGSVTTKSLTTGSCTPS